jgi:hypothetical protein
MPHYTFPAGELTAEHKRSAVHDIDLDVTLHEAPELRAGPEFLNGSIQVCGELGIDCAPAENRLRPGMLAMLTLAAPDGRYTRLTVLLTGLLGVTAPAAQRRVYRWGFLVPARPSADPTGLFRRPGDPPPPPPLTGWPVKIRPAVPVLTADPAAREVSLEELLSQLGGDGETTAVRFTSEGGFEVGEEP